MFGVTFYLPPEVNTVDRNVCATQLFDGEDVEMLEREAAYAIQNTFAAGSPRMETPILSGRQFQGWMSYTG